MRYKKRLSVLFVCLFLILVLSLSIISAGWFSNLFNKLRGEFSGKIIEHNGTDSFCWKPYEDRDWHYVISYVGDSANLIEGLAGEGGEGLIYYSADETNIGVNDLFGFNSSYGCAEKINSVWHYNLESGWITFDFQTPLFLNDLNFIEHGEVYNIFVNGSCTLSHPNPGSFWESVACANGEICSEGVCVVNESELIQPCIDSDATEEYFDGKNYFVKGNVTWGITSISEDYCQGDLREAYCNDDGVATYSLYTCPDGAVCENGACIIVGNCTSSCIGKTCGNDGCGGSCGSCDVGEVCIEAECIIGDTGMIDIEEFEDLEILCIDTDVSPDNPDGLDYYFKGSVELIPGGSADDVCISENVLEEQYCDGDRIKGKSYKCLSGCENGACILKRYSGCYRTDEGDIYTKGKLCLLETISEEEDCIQDSCGDGAGSLSQFECISDSEYGQKWIGCLTGCKDGECISEPSKEVQDFEKECDYHFECRENFYCFNGGCVSISVWERLALFTGDLFGI